MANQMHRENFINTLSTRAFACVVLSPPSGPAAAHMYIVQIANPRDSFSRVFRHPTPLKQQNKKNYPILALSHPSYPRLRYIDPNPPVLINLKLYISLPPHPDNEPTFP